MACLARPAQCAGLSSLDGLPPYFFASTNRMAGYFSAITSSGYAFIARCGDQAFARTRYPQNLAERCERLLRRWRWEANVLARRPAEGPRIPNYADALRSSAMAGMPMGNSL